MSDIAPNDVVVCVDDAPYEPNQETLLAKGRYYRVTRVGPLPSGRAGLSVEGQKEADGSEAAYLVERFRKIEPGKLEFEGLTERVKDRVS